MERWISRLDFNLPYRSRLIQSQMLLFVSGYSCICTRTTRVPELTRRINYAPSTRWWESRVHRQALRIFVFARDEQTLSRLLLLSLPFTYPLENFQVKLLISINFCWQILRVHTLSRVYLNTRAMQMYRSPSYPRPCWGLKWWTLPWHCRTFA